MKTISRAKEEIAIWIWFSIIIAMLPFFVSIWCNIGPKTLIVSMLESIKGGELLLLSAFIMAGLIGEIVKAKNKQTLPMIWTLGPLAFGVIFCSMTFGKINGNNNYEIVKIALTSLIFFISAIILGITVFSIFSREDASNGG